MQAIRNGNIDTVKLLLEKDAKVDKVTYLGKQKQIAAVRDKLIFIIKYNDFEEYLYKDFQTL